MRKNRPSFSAEDYWTILDKDFDTTETFHDCNEEDLSYANRRQSEATHGYQTCEEPIRP